MILWLSKILLPFVISYVIAFGLISHRPIFDDFLDGAKSGMKTVADILPTLIALITLVVAWIVSMAVFDKESKVKSKVISFACVIAAVAYLISNFISLGIL